MVYALDVFAKSPVDEIILVAAPGETEYCRGRLWKNMALRRWRALWRADRSGTTLSMPVCRP